MLYAIYPLSMPAILQLNVALTPMLFKSYPGLLGSDPRALGTAEAQLAKGADETAGAPSVGDGGGSLRN